MQIITKEFQVFKFEELDAKIQEKVINKYYENEDYPWLESDLLSQLNELDNLKIFSDIKLQYSLSYCQGDGLCFASTIDLHKFLKAKGLKNSVIDVIYNQTSSCKSISNRGRYSFPASSQIVWDIESLPVRLDKLVYKLENELKDYYLSICRQLEKEGYIVIEYRMSTQEFIEHCDANDYTFLADGKMFNI